MTSRSFGWESYSLRLTAETPFAVPPVREEAATVQKASAKPSNNLAIINMVTTEWG